ncbi:MAG TPA: tRNA (adenosine(37)-N6)-dimethylallyltransferase MiaA [Caulobacteraceae bacterium]|nr:tRNA (adenosine(37)-N6)-dimethylallyltransferase MiaA [Caulobacteraceae bacterium]
MGDERRVRLIAGPTASGKSALALRLSRDLDGVIVNADSMQLYRDLRVLTARPSPEEEAQAPHRLYGVADAADVWSVGRWLRAATEVLAEIQAQGRTAIVVGGTGLYFRALTRGLAEVPPVPPAVRTQIAALYDRLGEDAFRARLTEVDPEAAARISPGDRQRLARALEVHAATGRALSDWQAGGTPLLSPDAYEAVVVEPSRDELYRRCDARLDAMVAAGALDEVRALVARGLDPALPAMKAVGLRELAATVRGELSLADAVEAAKRETRRYAKRQLTWFRNQTPEWPRVEPG